MFFYFVLFVFLFILLFIRKSAANVAPVEGKVTWFQIQFQEDIHKAVGEDVLK